MQSSWSAELQTLEGHSNSVNAVAFLPDGKLLASGSFDNTVRLWDPATGAALQTLEGHGDSVNTVAFSPDGKMLASGSYDKTVRLWDPATGAALQTLEGHRDSVRAVTFPPDGKMLASGSADNTVRLWDPATGAALQTLEGHRYTVRAVAFSPDGKLLASGSSDNTVRLWDPATGAALQTLDVGTIVAEISFSGDGQYIETDRGPLRIQSSFSNLSPPRTQSFREVFVKENWITRDGENLLWLPSDYRTSCSALYGNLLVLGCPSGQVACIEFRS
jgi:WD40 repeat protein